MYKSARCSNIVTKPPKPPCWRDFVDDPSDAEAFRQIYFTDLNKFQKPGLQVIPGVGDGFPTLDPTPQTPSELAGPPHHTSSNRSGKHGKRLRAKLHRTRSQMLIQEEDLPNGSLTVNLSETKAREFGLNSPRRHIHVCDERRYLEENKKRCQTWLATVEACQPLDDIAFAQGSGVDVEIPEECWGGGGSGIVQPPQNSSASSSEDEGTVQAEVTLKCSTGQCPEQTLGSDSCKVFEGNDKCKPPEGTQTGAKVPSISVNKLKRSTGTLRSLYSDLGECRASLR